MHQFGRGCRERGPDSVNPYYNCSSRNSPHPSAPGKKQTMDDSQWLDRTSNSSFLLCRLKKRKKTHTAHSHNINRTRRPVEFAEGEAVAAPPAWLPQLSPRQEVAARWLQAPRPVAPAFLPLGSAAVRGVAGTLGAAGEPPRNPGQAAKRPGCAQPSHAPRPAGGQARGPVASWPLRPVRSGPRERPCGRSGQGLA